MKISASLLAASRDFASLRKQLTPAYRQGLLHGVHVDVMDGKFVRANTLSWQNEALVKQLRKAFPKLHIAVHLMVLRPVDYLERFAEAGADWVYFHVEACKNESEELVTTEVANQLGFKVGIAINPRTDLKKVAHFGKENEIDGFLVMSVQPGKGGQKFRPSSLKRIHELKRRFPGKNVNVDGGINAKDIQLVKKAGATCVVAGTAVFSGDIAANLKLLARANHYSLNGGKT